MTELMTRKRRRSQRKKNTIINRTLIAVTLGCTLVLGGWGADYLLSHRNIDSNNSDAVQALTEAWEQETGLPATDPKKEAKISEKNQVAVEQALKLDEMTPGKAFATITIPKLFAEPQAIAEGYGDATTEAWEANNSILDELRFAHYASTAAPGEPGSFAISGHRNGPGAVLGDLESLAVGDTATVRTAGDTFEYSVVQGPVRFADDYTGFTDNYPLFDEGSTEKSDVAKDPNKKPGKYLTVTSCGWWDASVRVAVVFELVEQK